MLLSDHPLPGPGHLVSGRDGLHRLEVGKEVEVAQRGVDGGVGEVDPEDLGHVGKETETLGRRKGWALRDRVAGRRRK